MLASPDLAETPDGELARRIAASRGAARAEEAELCRRFAPRVRLYGLRHLREEHAAADLVQRVLVLVLTKLRAGELREPEQVGSFTLGVARMTAREMGRGARREQPHGPETLEAVGGAAAAVDPLPRERLAGCLGALSERERAVVVLTFYDDEDAGAIAAALSIQEGNVRVIRHRAIDRLRRCLGLDEQEGAVA